MNESNENTEAECVKDVFRAGVRVASAPGSVTAKTTKSGTILRTEISRGQLVFASDNPPANFNA